MKDVRNNALWNELTADQLKALDKWLFEEKQSIADVWQRAQAQLGFKGSVSSMKRYYARRRRERTATEFKDLRDRVADVSAAPTDGAMLQSAFMKLVGRFLFEQMQQSPESAKELAAVARLLVQNDRNEVRREWLKFAKEKFQFDMVEQAMKALPELQELAQARKDPDTKRYEANAFLNMARRRIAGVVWEVKPESAQEEAEMLAARKAREERKQRPIEWEQREKITGHEPPTPSSPYYAEYLEWKAKRENKDEDGE